MASFKTLLTLAAALALAWWPVRVASTDLEYDFCRDVDSKIRQNVESWKNATIAYESAMAEMRPFASLAINWRRQLANGWRAVTSDEPCGPKSLAYVSAIHACKPSEHPTQASLDRDVRAYARKCLTPGYLDEVFQKHARDQAGVASFLTSDLLADYRRANEDEPKLHFGLRARSNCCRPLRVQLLLAAAMDEKYPKQTAKFRVKTEKAFEKMRKFLGSHLYKPCVIYVKRVVGFMKGVEAAAHYALNDDLGQLSHGLQDAIFRYNFCVNLKLDGDKERFNQLMVNAFW